MPGREALLPKLMRHMSDIRIKFNYQTKKELQEFELILPAPVSYLPGQYSLPIIHCSVSNLSTD
jgi:hypothetical protein